MTGTARLSGLPSPVLTLCEEDHAQNCQCLDEWVCRGEQQLIFVGSIPTVPIKIPVNRHLLL